MAGEGVEVAVELVDVGRHVGRVLRAVDEDQGAGGVGGVGQALDGIDRAQDVGDAGHPDELHAVDKTVEVGEVELAVVGEGQVSQLDAALFTEDEPRNQVGVVLHLREQDGVPLPEVGTAPGVGDEVDGLGGVLGEDDLARRRGIEESAHRFARALEAGRGLLGDLVDGPVDVGVARLHEVVHGLDDGPRLLRAVGRVEVDESVVVGDPVEDREVLLDRRYV